MSDLLECDWLISWGGAYLHFAEDFDEAHWEQYGVWKGKAACGQRGSYFIPGLFDRMGTDRCSRCCKKLGYPAGVGSPKNDDTCKERLQERLGRPLTTLAEVTQKETAE